MVPVHHQLPCPVGPSSTSSSVCSSSESGFLPRSNITSIVGILPRTYLPAVVQVSAYRLGYRKPPRLMQSFGFIFVNLLFGERSTRAVDR